VTVEFSDMHEFHKQLARRVSEEIPMRAGAGRAARVRSAQNIRRRLIPLLQGRRTFGHHDWLVIGEFPDDKAAASAVLAAAAGVVSPTSKRPSLWSSHSESTRAEAQH
jgi:uncharacterized protein with GYD domain